MKLNVLGSARARFRCIVGMWWGAMSSMVLSSLPLAHPTSPDVRRGEVLQMANGARTYACACVCCHGPEGEGRPPHIPSLRGSGWLSHSSDQALAAALLHGIAGPLSPKQPATGIMPALGIWLDDVQIAAAASYARAEFTGRSSLILPETVAEVRGWAGTRSLPWTWPELSEALRNTTMQAPRNLPDAKTKLQLR